MKLTTTRYLDGEIRAYHLSGNVYGPLELAATYKVESSSRELSHAVAPNLDRAVYTTSHSVVCINQNRDILWRYDLEPRSTVRNAPSPECVFSLDGTWVWVYHPDAMADRGPDSLVVLRAETGEDVARTELDTVGEGAVIALHPDQRHILLNVAEGQDGVKLYRVALIGDKIDLLSYGWDDWDDRKLVDVAPDGRWFMTVDLDFAFHAFASGEVVLRIPLEAFGYKYGDDEASPHWNGGFLNADIAVVTIVGEKDDEEWHCRYSIDLRTGTPLGRFEAHSRDRDDFEPLGDGTWIVSGHDGSVIRRQCSQLSEVVGT